MVSEGRSPGVAEWGLCSVSEAAIKVPTKLCSHLEAWLEKETLPSSFRWLAGVIPLWLLELGALASHWLLAEGPPGVLEVTCSFPAKWPIGCWQPSTLLLQGHQGNQSRWLAKWSLVWSNVITRLTPHLFWGILWVRSKSRFLPSSGNSQSRFGLLYGICKNIY